MDIGTFSGIVHLKTAFRIRASYFNKRRRQLRLTDTRETNSQSVKNSFTEKIKQFYLLEAAFRQKKYNNEVTYEVSYAFKKSLITRKKLKGQLYRRLYLYFVLRVQVWPDCCLCPMCFFY